MEFHGDGHLKKECAGPSFAREATSGYFGVRFLVENHANITIFNRSFLLVSVPVLYAKIWCNKGFAVACRSGFGP